MHIVNIAVLGFIDIPFEKNITKPSFYVTYLRWFEDNHAINLPENNQFLVSFRNGIFNFKTE